MLLFVVMVFILALLLYISKFFIKNTKCLIAVEILILILWTCLVGSRITSLIKKEKHEIIEMVASLDENKNIKKLRTLDVVYTNPELSKHRDFILEQMDTLVANNVHYSSSDFRKKTEKEREIYKKKNKELFYSVCKRYDDFWHSPDSKSLVTIELYFQAHYLLNCYSDRYYHHFEYEKLLESCGCSSQ